MTELGIEVRTASSPQAKGRVERSFKTHQDRLVKKVWLPGDLDPRRGQCVPVGALSPGAQCAVRLGGRQFDCAHRPLLRTPDLARILCVRIERTLRADWTLRCRNQWFQLLPQQPVALRPKDTLVMEFRLDGSIQLRAKGRTLASTPLA